jgi:ribosome-associated translation inhibitor RaiA
MSNAVPRDNLRVRLDTQQCKLSHAVTDKMATGVESLRRQVEHFPLCDLQVLVEHNARSNDYSVKTSLLLPGATLVCSEHSPQVYTAFEKCVATLENELQAYKGRLDMTAERQKQEKGTHHALEPSIDPDPAAVEAALNDGDYAAFRAAVAGYEEPVRKRVGRRVERYPAVNGRIDKGLKLDDIVEEVFLDAFEGCARRPKDVRFGDWLERLIDQAIKELMAHPDAEMENINLARAARAAEQGPGAV